MRNVPSQRKCEAESRCQWQALGKITKRVSGQNSSVRLGFTGFPFKTSGNLVKNCELKMPVYCSSEQLMLVYKKYFTCFCDYNLTDTKPFNILR